jgi:hypothetical protein
VINIVVNYGYQKLGAAALPEEEKWGFGKMRMVAERFPETEEEKIEVARTIGLAAGYEAVAIQKIEPLDQLIDDGDVIIEGTIVDDSE